MENELIVDANYDFDKIAYVPIRFHQRTGFAKIIYSTIELRWPHPHELTLIAEWFKREDVYRAFGFSQPPAPEHIERARLPDLTTRERHFEEVEFLIVRDVVKDKLIGFLVVYENRGPGDPNQEIDFAYTDAGYLGQVGILRKIEHSVQSYLFAIRGARSVFWVRRKQMAAGANRSGGQSLENSSFYQQKGKPVVITRRQFKRRLERRRDAGRQEAFPIISLIK